MNEQTQNKSGINKENQTTTGAANTNAHTQDNLSASENKPAANLNVESAKETAKGIYDQAKDTAGQAYGVATKRATEVIEDKKVDLAGGLTSVAESIKQVGENLRETDTKNQITETAAKYSEGLAQQIEKASAYFENRDVREMIGDVERFARRNPALFIGAAFGLGLFGGKILKEFADKLQFKL